MKTNKTVEVEFKVQIPRSSFRSISARLRSLGFKLDNKTVICDNFLSINRSQVKGFDFTRLREYSNGKLELTKKYWIKNNKDKLRSEESIYISNHDLELLNFALPALFKVTKLRHHYINSNVLGAGYFMTVCIDHLRSPLDTNLLLEAEILADENTFTETSSLVRSVVCQLIQEESPKEADGFLKYCGQLNPDIKRILDNIN
jgi:adenylate cyclase class IV